MWKLGVLWWKFKNENLDGLGHAAQPGSSWRGQRSALLAAIYIISPVDLVPDLIPILGWLDDGVISTC